MATGIAFNTRYGATFFSTDSQTWNYIGHFIAGASATTSQTFPTIGILGEVLIQKSAVDRPPTNQEGYIANVGRSGNTISAWGGNVRTLVIVLGR
jgi:hypothetical protein